MIIDIKYHVASLVAVFLALALGIIMGMSLLSGQSVLEKQQAMVDSLRDEFDQIKKENEEYKNKFEKLESKSIADEKFIRNLMPAILKGRLEGRNYLLIRSNQEIDLTEINNSLSLAGGKVEMVVTIRPEFVNIIRKHGEKYAPAFGVTWSGDEGDIRDIVRGFAGVLLEQSNEQSLSLLDQLQNDGAISFSGKIQDALNGVVIAGGAEHEENNLKSVDIPMLEVFRNHSVLTVGVEEYFVPLSYSSEYRKKDISTIDNIDSNIGLISLVGVLAGDAGNYGLKGASSALMPDIIEGWISNE